jgi:hypothetical protein
METASLLTRRGFLLLLLLLLFLSCRRRLCSHLIWRRRGLQLTGRPAAWRGLANSDLQPHPIPSTASRLRRGSVENEI